MLKIITEFVWGRTHQTLISSRAFWTMSSTVVVDTKNGPHKSTVIFLHGLGDTGHGWASTIAQIKPSHTKCICPTAKKMPVTLNMGFEMPSWFDLKTLDANGPEDEKGINEACGVIHKIIDEEQEKFGIPANKIILGGFSQGGALALYAAFRYPKQLAGVVAFSCWLPIHKQFPAMLQEANKDIPILQCHGDEDPIVPCQWGVMSSTLISKFNRNHEFKVYKGLSHSSSEQELRDAKSFMAKYLPE